MLPPIQFVLPLLASTCLLVAGSTSKSRKPSGPPTFQAVLTILGSGPADYPTVARQLQGRAGALDTFLETKAGSATDKIVVFLYQDTEEEARAELEKLCSNPKLEFRGVFSSSDGSATAEEVRAGTRIVPGYKLFEYTFTLPDGSTKVEPLLLEKKPSVTGAHIASAWPDTTREGVLNVTLTPDGGTRMERLSKPMEKGLDRIAIVLNDEVISALVAQAPLKAEFIIQGLRDHDELTGLANALNIPLAAELKLESLTALPAP
ncbi:MAG: hypothetical protein VCA73_10405 [Roseibacillus sp.]